VSQPTHPQSQPQTPAAEVAPLDLREKGGMKNGQPQLSDKRLFMQLTAFTGCRDAHKLINSLIGTGVDCVLYEELNDPTGVAVLAMSDDPNLLITKLRHDLNSGLFSELTIKHEFSMLGRTYSIGYEPQLEDWLLHRPKRVVCDDKQPWAVWYPLRRTGAFSRLPKPEQQAALKEHGNIGRQFGEAGVASDIRLACHGLDKNDNDFVIGLIGKDLFPLSALVETMRPTVQTSQYIQNLGPFFVGRMIWHTPLKELPK
jgi:chlorite dismutase